MHIYTYSCIHLYTYTYTYTHIYMYLYTGLFVECRNGPFSLECHQNVFEWDMECSAWCIIISRHDSQECRVTHDILCLIRIHSDGILTRISRHRISRFTRMPCGTEACLFPLKSYKHSAYTQQRPTSYNLYTDHNIRIMIQSTHTIYTYII